VTALFRRPCDPRYSARGSCTGHQPHLLCPSLLHASTLLTSTYHDRHTVLRPATSYSTVNGHDGKSWSWHVCDDMRLWVDMTHSGFRWAGTTTILLLWYINTRAGSGRWLWSCWTLCAGCIGGGMYVDFRPWICGVWFSPGKLYSNHHDSIVRGLSATVLQFYHVLG
jgi:hypothetical protein